MTRMHLKIQNSNKNILLNLCKAKNKRKNFRNMQQILLILHYMGN